MSLANLALHQSPASLTSSRCRFPLTVPNPASNLTFRSGPSRPLGIRASAEPEPSQTSDSSSTSAVKEPAAGKAAAGKPAAGKGFGKAPQQPAVVRRPAPSQPLLSTRPVGEEEKKAAEIETAVVASLGFVFLLIILEGLFLAAAGACNAGDLCVGGGLWGGGGGGGAGRGKGRGRGGGVGGACGDGGVGFLSEELDQLAMDLVYPAFSPTVAVFLLGATAYGAFKVIGIGGKKQ
ncbi:unnamed protein product [Closterium sp. NIES-65]|nr:unnamed protein product [Closterium sp. NIES-65]